MRIHFWGTRGSLPAPLCSDEVQRKVRRALEASRGHDLSSPQALDKFIDELPFSTRSTYGGDTSCVQVILDHPEIVLFDAGSGLRDFSGHFIARNGKKPTTFHIFISHLHWDHLQGFPFFGPAYMPGNTIIFHGCHPNIEAALRGQMSVPFFPYSFDQLPAKMVFDIKPVGEPFDVAGCRITTLEQNHPGKSYGYRVERDGKVFVYSTDSEHKASAYQQDYPFVAFFKDADLLVFDAMYSLADATFAKADWGHSSNVMAVELAARARVKKLVLFHHDPTNDDERLDEFLYNTRMYGEIYHQETGRHFNALRFPEDIALAYDGMELEL